MLKVFYVFLSITIGFFAMEMFFIEPSTNLNLKCLSILFFISFIGHIISLWRELDIEEESYRQKIKEMNNE